VKIIISNTSGVPIYEQIKDQIKSAILSGEIEENELLPSLRQLARDLKISVLTTTRAYSELEQEGFVTNVQGKGCYVMGKGSELIREQLLRGIEENLTNAIQSARRAEVSGEELINMLKILMEDEEND
jgi:GntR family transcriptional regulator